MDTLFTIVTNACTLVTLNYLAIKIRNRMLIDAYGLLSVPLFTGCAAILMMLQPLDTGLVTLDLRLVPIVMAGLRYGGTTALLSSVIPATYSYLIGGLSEWWGIAFGLVIPAIVSALHHNPEYRGGYARIRFADGLKTTGWLILAQTAVGYALMRPEAWTWFGTNLFLLAVSGSVITLLIGMYNDEINNWMLQRQLELRANQDGLTRLPNFRSFQDIGHSMLSRRRIAIMMIDIDNFKNYNDTLGHQQGDQLLRQVGEVLRQTIGMQDYIARYGGEEFIVMCHTPDPPALHALAQHICREVTSTPFPGREIQPGGIVSVSIGISIAQRPGDDLHQLIAEADEALYMSKHNGKNQYHLYQTTAEPVS